MFILQRNILLINSEQFFLFKQTSIAQHSGQQPSIRETRPKLSYAAHGQ